VRIVHLADAHVARGGSRYLPGVDLVARFEAALASVRGLDPRPDHVVLGGDILDEPSPDYGLLARLAGSLDVPVHLCLGNHDTL
jgi:3',5'-cyclic-AMP phosphodiesterase